MTAPTPVGFLDFFILEASDYVEQLDALLDAGGASGPDPDGLQRVARALRGSATMAKLLAFAEVAAGLERVGRALREGALPWEAGLSGVVVAAVDDCKLLLRHARTWGDADDSRARAHVSELTQYAAVRGPASHASASLQERDNYLATESSNIGAGLELLATRPSDRSAAANVIRRVRALRGIASVRDHPALADVLQAAERAARPLELGEPSLSGERIALLAAAATVLRGVASAIRGGAFEAPPADVARFAAALDALRERETGADRVVPIAELFFDDGGAKIVDAATNPPNTPAKRFRLEAVSQGEHLQRLVSDARAARDDLALERVRRELRQALRSLHQTAESFGEKDVADLVASHESAVARLDAGALESLDEVATLLITPPSEAPKERVLPRAAAMTTAMETTGGERAATPMSRLGHLLDAGIEKLGSLRNTPLSVPSAIADQPPIPIEVLLYRGRAAIERCVQIRDEVRGSGGTPDVDSLGEIFDLLDLALTD